MKFKFLLFVICVFSCCTRKVYDDSNHLKLVGQIDLQAGFDNDSVSLKVNDNVLLKQRLIQSKSSSDYSGTNIKFYKHTRNSLFYILSNNSEKKISFINLDLEKQVNLEFKINDRLIKLKHQFNKKNI